MFGGETLLGFGERLGAVLRRDLCLDSSLSKRLAAEGTEMLATGGVDALEALRARLAEWDIGAQWGQLLRDERAQALAEWVDPYVRGTVLHLLCGDGLVGERLSELGPPVLLVDREGGCPVTLRGHALAWPGSLGAEGELPLCDTVLLCTAMHAEEEPDAVLEAVARSSARRLVLVEQVVEDGGPAQLHLLMDLFFERCLGAPVRRSRGRRTAEEWLAACERRGRVAALERWESVPGVPLPHALIAVDLECEGASLPTGDLANETGTLAGPRPARGGGDGL